MYGSISDSIQCVASCIGVVAMIMVHESKKTRSMICILFFSDL